MSTSRYDYLKKRYCPKDVLTEIFVAYYGEDSRILVENMIDTTEVIFVADSNLMSEIREEFKLKYDNQLDVDWQKLAYEFINNLQALSNGSKDFDIDLLYRERDILRSVGFDPTQMFLSGKITKRLKLNNKSKATREFSDSVSAAFSLREITDDVVDLDSFIDTYNSCARDKVVYSCQSYKSKKGQLKEQLDIRYIRDDFTTDNVEFPTLQDLNKKEKEFLLDFFSAKGSVQEWDEEYLGYIVNGLNKLFNKDFKTISEIREDKSLLILLKLRDLFCQHIQSFMITENANKMDYIESSARANRYDAIVDYFRNNPNVVGSYDEILRDIYIPVGTGTSFGTVLHEYNHAFAYFSSNACGFSKESVGFNEIVNEYLTQQLIMKSRSLIDQSVRINVEKDCAYAFGIEILKPFLDKYENELKKCQIGWTFENCDRENAKGLSSEELIDKMQNWTASMELKEFIGEDNFKKLMAFSDMIADQNYGQSYINVFIKGEQKDLSLFSVITACAKIPATLELVAPQHKELITKFMDYYRFVEKLAEHYEDFEKGNIINILLDSELKQMNDVREINLDSTSDTNDGELGV
ncbi:MAG: hypothetical protein IKC49_03870 [Clostridia bacterium]|nr:hypothetical protein [Clostridia bacterium]